MNSSTVCPGSAICANQSWSLRGVVEGRVVPCPARKTWPGQDGVHIDHFGWFFVGWKSRKLLSVCVCVCVCASVCAFSCHDRSIFKRIVHVLWMKQNGIIEKDEWATADGGWWQLDDTGAIVYFMGLLQLIGYSSTARFTTGYAIFFKKFTPRLTVNEGVVWLDSRYIPCQCSHRKSIDWERRRPYCMPRENKVPKGPDQVTVDCLMWSFIMNYDTPYHGYYHNSKTKPSML